MEIESKCIYRVMLSARMILSPRIEEILLEEEGAREFRVRGNSLSRIPEEMTGLNQELGALSLGPNMVVNFWQTPFAEADGICVGDGFYIRKGLVCISLSCSGEESLDFHLANPQIDGFDSNADSNIDSNSGKVKTLQSLCVDSLVAEMPRYKQFLQHAFCRGLDELFDAMSLAEADNYQRLLREGKERFDDFFDCIQKMKGKESGGKDSLQALLSHMISHRMAYHLLIDAVVRDDYGEFCYKLAIPQISDALGCDTAAEVFDANFSALDGGIKRQVVEKKAGQVLLDKVALLGREDLVRALMDDQNSFCIGNGGIDDLLAVVSLMSMDKKIEGISFGVEALRNCAISGNAGLFMYMNEKIINGEERCVSNNEKINSKGEGHPSKKRKIYQDGEHCGYLAPMSGEQYRELIKCAALSGNEEMLRVLIADFKLSAKSQAESVLRKLIGMIDYGMLLQYFWIKGEKCSFSCAMHMVILAFDLSKLLWILWDRYQSCDLSMFGKEFVEACCRSGRYEALIKFGLRSDKLAHRDYRKLIDLAIESKDSGILNALIAWRLTRSADISSYELDEILDQKYDDIGSAISSEGADRSTLWTVFEYLASLAFISRLTHETHETPEPHEMTMWGIEAYIHINLLTKRHPASDYINAFTVALFYTIYISIGSGIKPGKSTGLIVLENSCATVFVFGLMYGLACMTTGWLSDNGSLNISAAILMHAWYKGLEYKLVSDSGIDEYRSTKSFVALLIARWLIFLRICSEVAEMPLKNTRSLESSSDNIGETDNGMCSAIGLFSWEQTCRDEYTPN